MTFSFVYLILSLMITVTIGVFTWKKGPRRTLVVSILLVVALTISYLILLWWMIGGMDS